MEFTQMHMDKCLLPTQSLSFANRMHDLDLAHSVHTGKDSYCLEPGPGAPDPIHRHASRWALSRPQESCALHGSSEGRSTMSSNLRKQLFLVLLTTLSVLLLAIPAAAEGLVEQGKLWAELETDRTTLGEYFDPAERLFQDPRFADFLAGKEPADKGLLDTVFQLTHDVPFGEGRTLRLYERFTLRAWFQRPRRALLMPSSFLGTSWLAPVEGYNGAVLAAREDFFAFAVDLVGTGESFKPENGRDVTFELNIEALEKAIRYIRVIRLLPKVDILGEGVGAALATQLAADPARVRSVVLASNLYLEQQGGPASDPMFIQFLQSIPDGYVFVPAETSAVFYQGSPPEFQAYFNETQAAFFSVNSFLISVDLPFYDPSVARVPGLVIQGENDIVAVPSDPFNLAADYGPDGADLVILEGVGRAPRFETPEAAARFWEEVFHFLD